MSRRTLLAAALASLALAARSAALTSGRGVCPSPLDFGGSSWVYQPHRGACTATTCTQGTSGSFQRWTRERVAACDGCIIEMGDDEQLVVPGSVHAIPSQVDTNFDLNFTAGSIPLSTANLEKYIDDVRTRVQSGHSGPVFVYAMRWDLLGRHDLDRTGAYAPQASWALRTDRDFPLFANWFRASGAGAQSDPRCDSVAGGANDGLACGWTHCRTFSSTSLNPDELWNATVPTTTGCNRTYNGTSQQEYGTRTYDLLNAISSGLGDDAVWYTRSSPSNKVFGAAAGAILADMLDTSYQDAMVDLCEQAIAIAGYDACDFQHKNHFYWWRGGSDLARRRIEFWIDIGDGIGGYNGDADLCGIGAITTTLDTLEEMDRCETPLSGPPERANGDAWQWDDYARAQVEIARKLFDQGIPYFRQVSPYWYVGCNWNGTSSKIGSTYTTAGCEGAGGSASCASSGTNCGFDDHTTAPADEAAYMREIVQKAGYVVIDLGGRSPTSPSIGSGGAGSGWSFEDLKRVIENPQAGVPAPRVVGYFDAEGQEMQLGTAPRLCADPGEENPLNDRLSP